MKLNIDETERCALMSALETYRVEAFDPGNYENVIDLMSNGVSIDAEFVSNLMSKIENIMDEEQRI